MGEDGMGVSEHDFVCLQDDYARAATGRAVAEVEVERLRKALRVEAADLRARYADPHRGTLIAANEMADRLEALVDAFHA